MGKMKVTVPYSYKTELLEALEKEFPNGEIGEIYFAAPQHLAGSGRPHKEPVEYDEHVQAIMAYCKRNGVESNLLFNALCDGLHIYDDCHQSDIFDYVEKLQAEGLTTITLGNTHVMPVFRKQFPDLKISAAVNLMTHAIDKMRLLQDLGCDVIVIKREANKDARFLKKLKKYKDVLPKTKMLVNEPCLHECPQQITHANAVGHLSTIDRPDQEHLRKKIDDGCFAFCGPIFQDRPWLFFKSGFVRPEDLQYYDGLIDYAKVVGRGGTTENLIKIIKAYVDRSWEGDLMELCVFYKKYFVAANVTFPNSKMPDGFHNMLSNCDKLCDGCTYCDDLYLEMHKDNPAALPAGVQA